MKSLTLRWPWSALIVLGLKPVENRSWKTPHRGPMALHEALRTSPADLERAREIVADDEQWEPISRLLEANRAPGCVIGTVELVNVVQCQPSKWAEPGKWHWVLRDPEPMEPVPAKGRLGLWEWNG
jgi:hypothetical protein